MILLEWVHRAKNDDKWKKVKEDERKGAANEDKLSSLSSIPPTTLGTGKRERDNATGKRAIGLPLLRAHFFDAGAQSIHKSPIAKNLLN